MRLVPTVVVVAFALSGSGCASKPECTAATCASGCCDSAGECQAGLVPTACGASAGVCQICLPWQSCVAGACFSGVAGGSGGSGGGQAGGGVGGGGTAGGSGGGLAGGAGGGGGAGGAGAGGPDAGADGGTGGGSFNGCDTTGTTATDYARALGICANLVSATFVSGDASARAIRPSLGTGFLPRQGSTMVHLSTGRAADLISQPTFDTIPGKDFGISGTQTPALYKRAACAPPPTVTPPPAYDKTQLSLVLTVPSGAKQLSFDYNFLTAEYPQYRCSTFTDRFAAGLTVQGGVTTNLALDSAGDPVSASSNSLRICASYTGVNSDNKTITYTCAQPVSLLAQTGYGLNPGVGMAVQGAATGWLTANANVMAGQQLTLDFVILDEGDGTIDSAVLLDNVRFQ